MDVEKSARSLLLVLGDWTDRRSERSVRLVAVVGIFLIGILDLVTGPDMAFSVFYLVPLSLVSWKAGATPAAILSAVAAVVWLMVDVTSEQHPNLFIGMWNAGSRFFVFLLVIVLLSTLRGALHHQQHLARIDPLTGVHNARAFEEFLDMAVEASQLLRQPLSIAYVDLDNFKSINDALGHSRGNEVLRAVASALDATTRSGDIVGRLGGDEFGIILIGADSQATRDVMDDLTKRVSNALSHLELPVTLSAGAATFLSAPDNSDEMILAADHLMYEAKRDGKGGYRQSVFGKERRDAVPDVGARRGRLPRPNDQSDGGGNPGTS